ncbi:hypothetical protein [Frankia sp. CcWB3]
MAITVPRSLARRPASAAGPGPGPAVARTRAPRPAAGAGFLPRRAGGLPHELVFRIESVSRHASVRHVHIETGEGAVLADWWSRGRVELMAAGRPFVLETDLDGSGIRLVEPMGRVPLAAFEPGRHGGRVRLSDGATLRWLTPIRGEFASGLVGHRDVNIIRFALDGTALVVANPDALDPGVTRVARTPGAGSGHVCRGKVADPRLGWVPDVVALLVLGWFLRVVESEVVGSSRSRVRYLGA